MTGSNSVWRTVRTGAGRLPLEDVLPVMVVVALTTTVAGWATTVVVGTDVRLLGFVVVGAAVVVGRPARWGTAAALLVVGALFGTWPTAVTWAVAAFVTSTVVTRIWSDDAAALGWVAWARRYVLVGGGGVLLFAATVAWLLDVLGQAAFSVTVGPAVAANLPVVLLGAPLVRAASERTVRDHLQMTPERPLDWKTRAGVLLIALVWALGGYVGSFLFRTVEQVPPGEIERQFSPVLAAFLSAWGPQGTYAQLVLGLVALGAVGVLLRE